MEALRIISDEHKNFWRIAVTLEQVADELDAGGAVDPEFFRSVFDYIEQFADHAHHLKEDDHLFRLMRLRSAEAVPLIEALEQDHRLASEHLVQLRAELAQAGTGRQGALAASLRDYAKRLKDHITTEETEAMPLARRLLAESDWAEIDARFSDNQDPVFGEQARAEFRELYHRVVSLAPESVGLGGHSSGARLTTRW